MDSLSPGLVPILGSLLIPALRGRLRQAYLVLLPLLSAAFLAYLYTTKGLGSYGGFSLLGYDLAPVRIDGLSLTFAIIFHVALLVGVIFALHVEDPFEHVAAFVYGGSTIGAVFAGDLITLLVFWELTGLASAFLIWARRTERSNKAGMRYMMWQVVSGVILLAGILANARETGSIAFDAFALDSAGSYLLFLAFGVKCAFPALHTWLSDGYPEATPTGAVFLSAFTSKLAVYALARSFAGTEELVVIGCVMAAFPVFFAVIENDLRKVLSYSLINQVGFMVVAIGIGTPLAINGAAAHAFADVIFKGLLFMSMGAVLLQTGKIKGSELGGLYKSMPFTCLCCIVGAASISAFPLFSAFATKSIIMDAVTKDHRTVVWFVLLFAAAGVFHHAGIKIPYFAFFAHDSGLRPKKPPLNMRVAMGISALLCLGIGCFPQALYGLLPNPMDYDPYTTYHVVAQLQLLFFSALAFTTLMLMGLYPPELKSVNLDVDWIFRHLGGKVLVRLVYDPLALMARGFEHAALTLIPRAVADAFSTNPETGPVRSNMILGSSVLLILGLLVLLLWIGHTS